MHLNSIALFRNASQNRGEKKKTKAAMEKKTMEIDAELAQRREKMDASGKLAWRPREMRQRKVSTALKAYAALTTSADRGAVRDLSQIGE